MPAVQTIGASPKKIAATITAYISPIVAGFVAKKLGVDVEADTATTLLGPLVLAGCVYVAAHLAKPGKVYVDQTLYPDAFTGPNPPARVQSQEAPTVPEATPDDEAARKRSEASKKAAATRKRNKARKS